VLELNGHPFSSYTWKALIALYANQTPFEFRCLSPDSPDHAERVRLASPQGKFPLLINGVVEVFEATAIIEYLAVCYPGDAPLLPDDPVKAARMRMIDRVFDNYVMTPMQEVVSAYIDNPDAPDRARVDRARGQLAQSYAWLEREIAADPPPHGRISLMECAAAPALFYADWVRPIGSEFAGLAAWRAELLTLPPVMRCVDDARPFRPFFPPGAPDRD